jgi:hypothetical protein
VIGRNAVSNEAERHGQPVDHVDLDRDRVLAHQRIGGVDARGAGSDNSDPQWAWHDYSS